MDNKISIVIPVGDVAPYLRQCLASALGQTLREIEVVCVDDASRDGSLAILEEHARRDARLRLVRHSTVQSASQARKDGVLAAKGEFVMFLDGDDYLAPEACERLYREMGARRVDILHFGTHVHAEEGLPPERLERMRRFLRPHAARLEGQDILGACFRDGKFGFTLWNKIYAAELCQRSFRHIPDGPFPKAQDLFAFFILAYFARSYDGLADARLYHYRLGSGLTGHNLLTLERFARHCTQARVAHGIRAFLEEQGVYDSYRDIQRKIQEELLFECVWNWLRHLAPADQGRGFDMLVDAWGAPEVASCLVWRREYDALRRAMEALRHSWSYRIGAAITCAPRGLHAWWRRGVEAGDRRPGPGRGRRRDAASGAEA